MIRLSNINPLASTTTRVDNWQQCLINRIPDKGELAVDSAALSYPIIRGDKKGIKSRLNAGML